MVSFSSFADSPNGTAGIVGSAVACAVVRVQGYFRGAADKWLQFFDATAVPADTAVPIRSYALPATTAFSWAFDPNVLELVNGLVVLVSDTEATLTLSASVMDVFGEVEPRSYIPATTTAGDAATARSKLLVWSEATGAADQKRLYTVNYQNQNGFTAYLMLFAKDDGNTVNGDAPILWWPVTAGGLLALDFGDAGTIPFSQDKDHTRRVGCTLQESTTPSVLTKNLAAASNIAARYAAA